METNQITDTGGNEVPARQIQHTMTARVAQCHPARRTRGPRASLPRAKGRRILNGMWEWRRWLAAAGAFAALPALPAPSAAQWQFEVRAGVTGSTVLAEDLVANPALQQRLRDRFTGSVRAKPGAAVTVAAAAQTQLRARTRLGVGVTWTRAALHAEDGFGRRPIQTLHAGKVTVGVLYRVLSHTDAGCGFGALRYFASGGLFASGGELSPMVECGAGFHAGPGVLRGTVEVHRFRTPVLRDAGGQTGSVMRFSVQAGLAFPR